MYALAYDREEELYFSTNSKSLRALTNLILFNGKIDVAHIALIKICTELI